MIIGERGKSSEEIFEKHRNELVELLEGWQGELEFAIKKQNPQYEDYIKSCKEQILQLEYFLKESFNYVQ